MKKLSKENIFKIILAALSVIMLILSCIFLRELPKYVLLIAIIIFSSLGIFITNTSYRQHQTIFKLLLVLLAIASIVLISYIALDKTNLLEKFSDAETLLQLIRGTKHWGVIVFILLVIFQIVFLPIPTAVTAFIGSKLYGPTLAFIFITVGTIIGSILCFMLGKIFGKKLVNWMIGKEKTDKYADILNRKGRFIFIIMMLFPFFPDDIICLVAGITSMSYKYFITIVSITRPVMIAFMCYFVEGSIIPFSGWGIPVWIAILAITLVLFLLLNKLKNYLLEKKNNRTVKIKSENNQNN